MPKFAVLIALLFFLGCSSRTSEEQAPSEQSSRQPTESQLPIEFAFTSTENDHPGIYLWSDGQTKLLTPDFEIAEAPDWSPAGKRIAFQAKVDDNYDVYVLDTESGKTSRLTRDKATEQHPAWSPDGSTIAFISDRGNEEWDFDLYFMDSDGSNLRRLTRNVHNSAFLAWSPDGRSIAFSAPSHPEAPELSPESAITAIYVIQKDGTQRKRLTHGESIDFFPAWSPDGNRIAFSSNRVTAPKSLAHVEIYVMNADGSHVRRVSHLQASNICPSWSPHPTKILFHSTRHRPEEPWKETAEIYVVNSDGTELTRLTNNDKDDYFPDWRPAQSHQPGIEDQ